MNGKMEEGRERDGIGEGGKIDRDRARDGRERERARARDGRGEGG